MVQGQYRVLCLYVSKKVAIWSGVSNVKRMTESHYNQMRSVELSGWNLFAIFTRLRQVYVFFFLHYVFVGIFVESIALSAIKYLC